MSAASRRAQPPRQAIVWRLCDGRAGHENQSAGLVEALWCLHPIRVHDLALPSAGPLAMLALRRAARRLPEPDLIVGAGRRTHRPLLTLARAHGGRTVVLMRPSLRRCAFDLCVVPRHDRPAAGANLLVTEGVLNRIRPGRPDAHSGLILLGGPSRHHDWLDREIVEQVEAIVTADPGRRWTVCDSRRTPKRTASLLAATLPKLEHVAWQRAPAGWLARRLTATRRVWVSEDSVSMVYESLTAGAAVGLLSVPRRRAGRVVNGTTTLIERGLVTPFVLWQGGRPLDPPQARVAEADRVARWIVEHWLTDAR